MQITRSNNGNYVFLRFSGHASEVAAGATRLFNYGVLATMPAVPKEGENVSVIATTYRKNLSSGFLSIAQTELANDRERTRAMKGKPYLFHEAAAMDAERMISAIPLESTILRAEETQGFARGPIIDSESDEEGLTPEIRKMGREIIAHFFGERRDSASRRSGGVED